MFDDPKKELKRLEAQLLAEEEHQDGSAGADDWFEDEEDWLDAELCEARILMGESPVRSGRPEDVFRFLEEDAEEEAPAAPIPAVDRAGRKRKEKGVGGLVFLACLETLGIIAVLLWWVVWLL